MWTLKERHEEVEKGELFDACASMQPQYVFAQEEEFGVVTVPKAANEVPKISKTGTDCESCCSCGCGLLLRCCDGDGGRSKQRRMLSDANDVGRQRYKALK